MKNKESSMNNIQILDMCEHTINGVVDRYISVEINEDGDISVNSNYVELLIREISLYKQKYGGLDSYNIYKNKENNMRKKAVTLLELSERVTVNKFMTIEEFALDVDLSIQAAYSRVINLVRDKLMTTIRIKDVSMYKVSNEQIDKIHDFIKNNKKIAKEKSQKIKDSRNGKNKSNSSLNKLVFSSVWV